MPGRQSAFTLFLALERRTHDEASREAGHIKVDLARNILKVATNIHLHLLLCPFHIVTVLQTHENMSS